MSGMIVERRLQVLMTFFSPRLFSSSTFFSRWSSTKGPFFRLRGMGSPPLAAAPAAANDQLLGRLVLVAGATLGLAPRRHRVPATGALALTTTEGMVDGVHRDAAGLRSHALPAVATRLAQLHQVGLGVADLADGGAAVDGHAAHLGGRKPKGGEVAFLGDELDACARAPCHLAAGTGLQLDVVHDRADRDVPQRQRVAGADLRALPGLEQVTDLRAARGEDVALLAVEIVQQQDAAVAVRVVLDGRHLRRHPVLGPLEVDHAVLLLVAATAMAGGLAALRVATARAVLGREQRTFGLALRDLREVRHRLEPATGAGGLALAEWHQRLPPVRRPIRLCRVGRSAFTSGPNLRFGPETWNRRPGLVGLRLRSGIRRSPHEPSKRSMRSSGCSVTIARFVSGRLPKVHERRLRLRLPLRLSVLTLATRTLNSCSMASWICGLVASGWTRNVYTFFSSSAYDFSDTIGSMMRSRGSCAIVVTSLVAGRRGHGIVRCARQRGAGEHHVIRHEHVIGVELAGEQAVHLGQVAEAAPHVLVVLAKYQQHPARNLERVEHGQRVLGLRGVESPVVDHHDLAVGGTVGQRRVQGEADHLLRGALCERPRLRAERDATAAPVGRTVRALPGAASALLPPRLRAAAGHLGPRARALRAGAAGGELRG